ncbi:MAG: GNAT family N-acetyltransferase [Proteobacteria bacterium]|nr:GNAT family N-acetyltransferase [Pseudomonadota bacterium]
MKNDDDSFSNKIFSVISKPNPKEVYNFLKEMNCDFVPPLSSQIILSDYVEKLCQCATCLFILEQNKIVGLSAIYCNDLINKRAFLTLFVIAKHLRRKGFATKLFNESLNVARSKKMSHFFWEVNSKNKKAMLFYEGAAKEATSQKINNCEGKILMSLEL